MTTIPQIAHTMQVILSDTAHTLGGTSGFVQRKSKLGGAELAQTLVFGWLANPQASLEELAQVALALEVSISAQGLEQRLGATAALCLQQVLTAAVQQVVQAQPVDCQVWQRFSGIYVQDSTTISLPAALAEVWAGCGGGQTPGDGSAALKVQVQWELRRGQLSAVQLQSGLTADRAAVGWLADLPAEALGLSDLGYFSLDRLQAQSQRGSFWLTRVQAGTRLVTDDGQSWAVSDWLATQGAATQIDQWLHWGATHQLPGRLLAQRVSPAEASARRRHLHAEARRRGQPVSPERLALADWTIYITNVPAEQLSLAEAWVLVRVRWQIELLFKLWKSHGQIDEWRSQKPWRILCEVYAKLLGQVVQHWIILVSCWACLDRSLVKAAQTVRGHALHLASAFTDPAAFERALTIVQQCLSRIGRLNKRRAHPSIAQLLADFDVAPV